MLPLMMFKLNLTSLPAVHNLILKFIPKLATHQVSFFSSEFDFNLTVSACCSLPQDLVIASPLCNSATPGIMYVNFLLTSWVVQVEQFVLVCVFVWTVTFVME